MIAFDETPPSAATQPRQQPFDRRIADIFCALGVSIDGRSGADLTVYSPIDGSELAKLRTDTSSDMNGIAAKARDAFSVWKDVPAPHRGELIRRYGLLVREHKEALSRLLTIENGKILTEARGEVQRWPQVPVAAKTVARSASPISALGATIAALLPPSSRMGRPNRRATRTPTSCPMRTLPVALTMAMSG